MQQIKHNIISCKLVVDNLGTDCYSGGQKWNSLINGDTFFGITAKFRNN